MENEIGMSYFRGLLQKAAKKQISLYLDSTKLEYIDMITKQFSSIGETSFARNTLIEEALDKYIAESKKFLYDEHGIDIAALIEEEHNEKYDTVVLSSNSEDDFSTTFFEEKIWYPCRISDDRKQNVSYIAIYRGGTGSPSAITHYAAVKKIEFDKERDCKVCTLDGNPIQLSSMVELGSKDGCFFRGAKYTKLANILNATKADDIDFI
jgi:hypothetical protein